MIRRPPRSTPLYSSAASDVYKRQKSGSADGDEVRVPAYRSHQQVALGSVDRSGELSRHGVRDRQALGHGDPVADLTQDDRHRDLERPADGREQLRGRFFLAALDLAQVAEGNPGRGRDLAKRASLRLARIAEHV